MAQLHLFTQKGIVKTTCNKQVLYTIILLERELREVYYQLKSCLEYGIDAFITHFQEQQRVLIREIRSLLQCLRSNVDAF
jgi:hypothetical protein